MENPRSKQVTQAILDYFISDMRPLNTIENEAFLGLFIAVDPMYAMFTLPEATQLERLLQKKYQDQKAVTGHTLQSAECVAIAVEKVSVNGASHVIVSASFITPEWQRFTKTLEAFNIRECTSQQVQKLIVQTMEEWNLNEKKIEMVSEIKYTVETCRDLTAIEQYTCFEKTLGTAASCIYVLPHIASVIAKVRQCVTRCQNDHEVKTAIDAANQYHHGPKPRGLMLDNAENWTSTLKMLQQFKPYR